MTAAPDDRRVLRLPEVIAVTGLSRSAIYARMSQGRFPNSVRLGIRAVGWRAADVFRWIDELPECEGRGR